MGWKEGTLSYAEGVSCAVYPFSQNEVILCRCPCGVQRSRGSTMPTPPTTITVSRRFSLTPYKLTWGGGGGTSEVCVSTKNPKEKSFKYSVSGGNKPYQLRNSEAERTKQPLEHLSDFCRFFCERIFCLLVKQKHILQAPKSPWLDLFYV